MAPSKTAAAATDEVEVTLQSEEPKDPQVLKREAYTAAEGRLKQEYADRFKALVTEEAEKRGVEYVFRKTAEEKAREQYEKLLAEYPQLAQQG